jgi:predicted nucleic acid-binding protein
MYLVDTNIFLEILLKQDKSDKCKSFLNDNIGLLNISDFSLHSIGVILFRQNQLHDYQSFINDTIPNINLVNLPKSSYPELVNTKESQNLDFDDSYQYLICKSYSLELVTMDADFKKTKGISVKYL